MKDTYDFLLILLALSLLMSLLWNRAAHVVRDVSMFCHRAYSKPAASACGMRDMCASVASTRSKRAACSTSSGSNSCSCSQRQLETCNNERGAEPLSCQARFGSL